MDSIVTIDGPAGAGKSTVARSLARRLGYRYLDTGALYRAVALAASRAGIAAHDGPALSGLARGLRLDFDAAGRTLLDGQDVSESIRTPEMSGAASEVSAHAGVREALLGIQRSIGAAGRLVCEGRDMGTVVFPSAAVKVFLDASLETRASRRAGDHAARGEDADMSRLRRDLAERDHRDATREAAPLVRNDSQIHVDTTDLTVDEVIDRLERLVRDRIPDGEMGAD